MQATLKWHLPKTNGQHANDTNLSSERHLQHPERRNGDSESVEIQSGVDGGGSNSELILEGACALRWDDAMSTYSWNASGAKNDGDDDVGNNVCRQTKPDGVGGLGAHIAREETLDKEENGALGEEVGKISGDLNGQ